MFEGALGDVKRAKEMMTAFQKSLACRSWLRKGEFWNANDPTGPPRAKDAIKKCLNCLINEFPRTHGQGWNVPKVHEQLHVPDDTKQNGPPLVTFSGVVEHQHVTTKKHAAQTRKTLQTLDKEVAQRMHETIAINESHAMMKLTMENLKKAHSEDDDKQSDRKKQKLQVLTTCKCEVQEDGSVRFEPQGENTLQDATNNSLSFLLGEWKLEAGDVFCLLSEI